MQIKLYTLILVLSILMMSCKSDTSKTPTATGIATENKNETPLTALQYAPGDVLNVFSIAGLNLRTSPGAMNSKIAKIYFGTAVKVLPDSLPKVAYSTNELKGFALTGNWVKVAYRDTSGYLFDGYLSSRAVPKKGEDFSDYFDRTAGKIVQTDSVKPANAGANIFEYNHKLYADGTNLSFQAYEGGFSNDIIFAPGKITLAEAYLLVKNMTVNTKPKYSFDPSKEELRCENEDSVWTITEKNGQVAVNYSFAD